jgi:hypothetical protein
MMGWICAILVGLTITVLPLMFRVVGNVDVFVDGGWAKVYFLWIRVLRVSLKLKREGDVYTIYIHSNKRDRLMGKVNLTTDTKDRNSIISIMTGSILGNLRMSDSNINVEIGRKADAIFTAIGLSTFRLGYTAFLSYVKSWQNIRTQERFVPVYDKNVFNIEFVCILRVNIADIMYGAIVQMLKTFKTGRKKIHKHISVIGEAL